MKQKVYWEQRMKELIKSENKILKELNRVYKRAYSKLELALSDIYIQMMEDGEVSPANLYKYDRYTTLQKALRELAQDMGKAEQMSISSWLKELYKSEFEQYAEFMENKVLYNVNEDMVEAAVKTNWSGEHFSERIWNNKKLLIQQLDKIIIDGIALGVSRKELNKMLLKKFDTVYYCADRIVRTESMFIYNRAHYDYYSKAGIRQYEFLAEIDNRTSVKCKDHNRKVYYLAEAQVGLNYPPLHPNCRSTVIPVIKR